MQLNEVYELIPWEVLKKWANMVNFSEATVNTNFPKYKNWTKKAVFADFLMDHVDEGFNFKNVSYPKAAQLKGKDLADTDFVELYKVFFDSIRAEENESDDKFRKEWEQRLQVIADRFLKKYKSE